MTNYVLKIMRELDLEKEACESLYADFLKIQKNAFAKAEFEDCIRQYSQNFKCDHDALLKKADAAAAHADIHPYSASLLLYLCLSDHLRELYVQRGIDLMIWHDSMLDLKWKAIECKLVKGIWGSFVAYWFEGFFTLERFALGRLQFEVVPSKFNYEKNGKRIKMGDPVINVHIPRTMTPLDRESCNAAYRRAISLLGERIGNTPMAFTCKSWFFYPTFISLYSPKSNLYRFVKDFDIVEIIHDKKGEYPNAWRLFDMDYTGDLDDFPEHSSLQRAVKQYMKDTRQTGTARGVFFADLQDRSE